MSETLNFPVYPFTYLKQDLSMKGVVPAFSPGISKYQFFCLLHVIIGKQNISDTKSSMEIFMKEYTDIDFNAPAFPFTTFINDQQVIAPGISIYELMLFLEYCRYSTVTMTDIASLFFDNNKEQTIIEVP